MLTVYRSLGAPGTLLDAQRAAQALADYLADPKHLAELVAASPGLQIGLASATPVRNFMIRAGLEDGRLFVVATELAGGE